MLKHLFILCGCFSVLAAQSQSSKDTYANTLLWRISGKGLSKPSYLYGTMHLTDKKVFQLGDSVYQAMEQTEGFAAELDMNSVGNQLVNQMLNEKEVKKEKAPVKLKDVVSEETWYRYRRQLEKKFRKDADQITVGDLEELESRLNRDLFKKGDMSTFLDAWLSGQARKLGKWVGGIEDLQDQLEHMDGIEDKIQLAVFEDDYYRKEVDRLKRIYVAQQLDSIDAMYSRSNNGEKDYIMIRRNLKMSRRMDSLMGHRSNFFAIGAAHLPGDSGVISLLRGRGYTLTPVFSSRKISADKYDFKGAGSIWVPVNIPDSSYVLKMPGEAQVIEAFQSMGLDMKMYFDLSFMRVYFTANIPMPEQRRSIGYDSLYKALRNRFSNGNKVVEEKAVTVNGVDGREFMLELEDGVMRMQIFIPKMEMVIMNALFTMNEKAQQDPDADLFFQSFSYQTRSIPRATFAKTWETRKFPALSFSIDMPQVPKMEKDAASDDGKTTYSWQSMDIKEQVFYGMNITAMKLGMYDSGNDEELYELVKNQMRQSFQDPQMLDSGMIRVNDYPGYQFVISGKSQGEEVVARIRYVFRGGVLYYYFSVHGKGSAYEKNAIRYLDSFTLLPYQYPDWTSVPSPDQRFTTSSPFPVKRKDLAEEEEEMTVSDRYYIHDSVAFVTTYIDRTELPGWLWFESDTGFLSKRAANFFTADDSVIRYVLDDRGPDKSVRLSVMQRGDNLVKEVKIILHDNELYEIYGHYASTDLPRLFDRVYSDFKVAGKPVSYPKGKGSLQALSKSLATADKKMVKEVRTYWSGLPFSAADIPELRRMALRIYPDFDSSFSDNLNADVFRTIKEIDSNYTSVPFFAEQYAAVKRDQEYLKPMIIAYLSNARTQASFAAISKCLNQSPIELGRPLYYFNYSFYDTLQLTATLYPGLLRFADSETLWYLVSGTATSLLDSGLIDASMIREQGDAFCRAGQMAFEMGKEELEDASYHYIDLIRILGIVNTAEARNLLTRFSRLESKYVRFMTHIAMIRCNMEVSPKILLEYAEDDANRHDLYDELEKINKLALFPKKYLTQQQLGKSRLYELASDDDPPVSIESVGSKKINYKGQERIVYLYKVSFGEGADATYYLGVAGPYDTNSGSMKSSHDVTGLFWDEEYDAADKDKQLERYLKMLEEYED